MPPKPTGKSKATDWYCKRCNGLNLVGHIECHCCGELKQAENWYTKDDVLRKEREKAAKEKASDIRAMLTGVKEGGDIWREDMNATAGPKGSEWECQSCGSPNGFSETECGCCGTVSHINPTPAPKPLVLEEYHTTPYPEKTLIDHDTISVLNNPTNLVEKCDICSGTVKLDLLPQHLEAHFAFTQLQHAEAGSDGLAVELQIEELKRFLAVCKDNALNKIESMKIATTGQKDVWKCRGCNLLNLNDVKECVGCGELKNKARTSSSKPKAAMTNRVEITITDPAECARAHLEHGAEFVSAGTLEYNTIVGFFIKTLTGAQAVGVAVRYLRRLQNYPVLERYEKKSGKETLMFHGSRTMPNLANIEKSGFLVNKCVSGGANFGTWLAYNSAYSDGGFASHQGNDKFLFLCLVKNCDIKLNNDTMRVVGQDCAYPCYIVCYRR
eukprot:TRINITY_DN26078_c0_g1_i1.p1 TRINITY_DN26078_c0_g1~~TRINITY_DN26078_c0_g1_i1.p1  ORF type:complete len:441 (+),score=100.52 TRINITY_DN26078_c0_g1_i1:53-1375(+)